MQCICRNTILSQSEIITDEEIIQLETDEKDKSEPELSDLSIVLPGIHVGKK
ncbi:7054_t:CDS:2 [Paraglomus brasilianum]|uniref:7054_t:CDS:1 n=1 Tax=Paraglomus brasilianum TaxID=144538 RepID=A0A9N8YWC1_9GLOM|nr:7054_t:CDS:2 [Paraglomus brasilianum]